MNDLMDVPFGHSAFHKVTTEYAIIHTMAVLRHRARQDSDSTIVFVCVEIVRSNG